MDSEIVAPRPSALVESLRSTGYSLKAAVADIIDNSISAGARQIRIEAHWDGAASWIAIHDDGSGMTRACLVEAMRLGGTGPSTERSPGDLGRFGLGLKTASFSQSRRLTVASKVRGNEPEVRRWDLDEIGVTDEWRLLHGASTGSADRIRIHTVSGTVVLWEQMDRIVGGANVSDSHAHTRFLDQLTAVKQHLAMTFHRFLAGRGSIRIHFNGIPVEPWDPFLLDHPATQHLPHEPLGAITVQPYVLPHVSRLTSSEYAAAAGPNDWYGQQGFYVYRNKRLLVPGDWLGLGFRRDQHHKLARIAVDLPNTFDADWSIDIKKSRARPPSHVRAALRRIAAATREAAAAVYRHRGKVLARTAGSPELLWIRRVTGGRWSYVINRNHPLVRDALGAPTPDGPSVRVLIRMLEETVPVSTIVLDDSEHPEAHATPYEGAPASEVAEVALAVYRSLLKAGTPAAKARERVTSMEPFPLYAETVGAALDSVEIDGDT